MSGSCFPSALKSHLHIAFEFASVPNPAVHLTLCSLAVMDKYVPQCNAASPMAYRMNFNHGLPLNSGFTRTAQGPVVEAAQGHPAAVAVGWPSSSSGPAYGPGMLPLRGGQPAAPSTSVWANGRSS